jgi:hypothetical protein
VRIISPAVTPLRARQLQLVEAVVARLQGRSVPELAWALPEVQSTGLATGLTALAASLGAFATTDTAVAGYLSEQREQVALRSARFHALTPVVTAAFAAADVAVVPVKGAVLSGHTGDAAVWPDPDTRPMSDIDLLVPSHLRAQASAVLVRAGWSLHSSTAHEDTFLAWGDGGVGRRDGESAEHNGRIELHPGWTEFLHGYLVHGFDLPPRVTRLTPPAFAVHVLGHLASTVVRAEVRSVNLLDVWFLHRAGMDWVAVGEVMTTVDPRLTAPGLWLVDRLLPEVVPTSLLGRELARLPHPEVLDRTEPAAVFRDATQRTSVRWRSAFATDLGERAAVARQLMGSVAGRVRRR